MRLLDAAERPEDMNIAGFRFHALQGKPKSWSVRVSGNYRFTFGWSGEIAEDILRSVGLSVTAAAKAGSL
jgi:proteic killer suppression protein